MIATVGGKNLAAWGPHARDRLWWLVYTTRGFVLGTLHKSGGTTCRVQNHYTLVIIPTRCPTSVSLTRGKCVSLGVSQPGDLQLTV